MNRDYIVILKNGKKVPFSASEEDLKDLDYVLALQEDFDYEEILYLIPWKDVKGLRHDKVTYLEEIPSYEAGVAFLKTKGLEGPCEVLQEEDLEIEKENKTYTVRDIEEMTYRLLGILEKDGMNELERKIQELGLMDFLGYFGEYQDGDIEEEELFTPGILKLFGHQLEKALEKLG